MEKNINEATIKIGVSETARIRMILPQFVTVILDATAFHFISLAQQKYPTHMPHACGFAQPQPLFQAFVRMLGDVDRDG